RQPVEQGLAQAIRRRPKPFHRRHTQTRAAQAAGNDAHLPTGLAGTPRTGPVAAAGASIADWFSHHESLMFKFWKKASTEPARPMETAPPDAPGSASAPDPVAAVDSDAQADAVGQDAPPPAAAHPATPAPADASQA